MPEYIDRKLLLEKAWDADTRAGYVQVVDVGDILDMPAADVAPVVHARWIGDGLKGNWCYCSNCKKAASFFMISDYCPNCGAKMDGGVDNETD